MRNKSSSSGGVSIDPGEPSPIAQEAQRQREELLARIDGKPSTLEEALPADDDEESATETVSKSKGAKVTKSLRTQKITLDSALFTLDIEVYDVQVRPNFICFSMPITTPALEPKDLMEMNLKVGGRSYPVIYAGGYFELPQHQLKAMSFLRDEKSNKENNDQRRKNQIEENTVDSDRQASNED